MNGGDADLTLFHDRNGNGLLEIDLGERLARSLNPRELADTIQANGLVPCNYYVQVNNYDRTTIDYQLTLTSDAAGSQVSTARDLGLLNNQVIGDFVGADDPIDLYRFALGGDSIRFRCVWIN
ncbi:MAG: hypothetical protein HC800_24855 [Phormidesmis sp. RL_2_1]|nr:hypothetical protein [Phormidesmis sp. RL_2_1]